MSVSAVTMVLVHGAWADGSSWSRVIEVLHRNSIKAVTAPLPLTSLADDVDVVQQIKSQGAIR